MTGANAFIDLNADLGEGGDYDADLMQVVSSCNIACGGHAGDADSMARTIQLAIRHGVAVGAHPSYPDPAGFGRKSLSIGNDELYESLTSQVETLLDIAGELGARVVHLKPHGALYNDAAGNAELADIVGRVASELPGDVCLVGPPGSELECAAAGNDLKFFAEAFVDRAYQPDGRLVSRTEAGAVYEDIDQMMEQALSLAMHNTVSTRDGTIIPVPADTLCIHGDTPGAANAARAVRDALESGAISIRSFGGGR